MFAQQLLQPSNAGLRPPTVMHLRFSLWIVLLLNILVVVGSYMPATLIPKLD